MARKLASLSRLDRMSLTKRYLFWLYKVTKDELDKIERKFTQMDIDRDIQRLLDKKTKGLDPALKKGIQPHLDEWQEYIFQKESDAQKLKFDEDGRLNASYLFLSLKLEAVTQIIRTRLGLRGYRQIQRLYEESLVKRILEDTSGKR